MEQQVIIITGASSGFGKATAEMLSAKGHIVYGLCRREMQDSDIRYRQCDVRNREQIATVVAEIVKEQGRVDVLINNAGMGIGGALELATEEEIDLQMGTNFMGCVNMCQAVLPYMRKAHKGKIINLSSIGGVMGLPYQGFYSASKFAIEGFTEALAAEVTGFGIRVCMVEPGDFATGFTGSRKNSQATMNDPDYGPIFKRSLAIIEKCGEKETAAAQRRRQPGAVALHRHQTRADGQPNGGNTEGLLQELIATIVSSVWHDYFPWHCRCWNNGIKYAAVE